LELGWYSPAAAVDETIAALSGAGRSAGAGSAGSLQASPPHQPETWRWGRYGASEGVIFLKTHKTGSSSLAGVFWRNFCSASSSSSPRSCFLPPKDTPGRTWDLSVPRDWRSVQAGASSQSAARYPFEVWTAHARYHPRLFSAVRNTDRAISIVRRPAQRFASAWAWYEHGAALQTTLASFSRRCSQADSLRGLWYRWTTGAKFKYRTGLEASTEELVGAAGFAQSNVFVQRRLFGQLLGRVAAGKLVLLVTDRFDESLLILGALMGWRHEQLVYSRLKVSAQREGVSDALQAQLDELQPFDRALWRLANHMLDLHIQAEFPDSKAFQRELGAFRQLNEQATADCKLLLQEKRRVSTNSSSAVEKRSRSRSWCEAIFRDNSDAVKFAWEGL